MACFALAPIFHSGCVLQRDLPLLVWGVGEPGAAVVVELAATFAATVAGEDGRWLLRLPALPAGGPHRLVARTGESVLMLDDVLLGDVWLCSGQSNAEWKLAQCDPQGEQAAGAHFPHLRLLRVGTHLHDHPPCDVAGRWTDARPETLLPFSALGGWFGRVLHRELRVPIGIIVNAWGGTRIESWLSREALMTTPEGRREVAARDREAYEHPRRPAQAYATLDAWALAEGPRDAGNLGWEAGWARPDLDDSHWSTMELPAHWQKQGVAGSGVVWFRKIVPLPVAWRGRPLELQLGAIDKHDDTYVNGVRVGGLSWENPDSWCTPRVYSVPADLTRGDALVVAVRARSHVFDGGLTGPAPAMQLKAGDMSLAPVPLAGAWRWQREQDWGVVRPPVQFGMGPGSANAPHAMFDTRIRPLLPYGLRGVIWYQGEANVGQAAAYRQLLPALIQDWRRAWGQGEFPFIQVQLAGYLAARPQPEESAWAELRDAQAAATSLPRVGLVTAVDLGDEHDIHPPRKRAVAERLARFALVEEYGRPGVSTGPILAGARVEAQGRIRLRFRATTRLHCPDGTVRQLAVADEKGAWRWAESSLEGATLVVWHPDVRHPTAVRYAWADNPAGANLFGDDGLPAHPFDSRTALTG